jgi:hypothetical protein
MEYRNVLIPKRTSKKRPGYAPQNGPVQETEASGPASCNKETLKWTHNSPAKSRCR